LHKLIANDFPHLLGGDRFFGRAQVLPERLIDERLVSGMIGVLPAAASPRCGSLSSSITL